MDSAIEAQRQNDLRLVRSFQATAARQLEVRPVCQKGHCDFGPIRTHEEKADKTNHANANKADSKRIADDLPGVCEKDRRGPAP